MQVSMTIRKAATINDTQYHVMCILNNTFTYELCDLGEVLERLCASVSYICKMGMLLLPISWSLED